MHFASGHAKIKKDVPSARPILTGWRRGGGGGRRRKEEEGEEI
jgi:hypothetical protein